MATYERIQEYQSVPITGEITVRRLSLVVCCGLERPTYFSLVTSSLSTMTAMVARKVLLSALLPTALYVEYYFLWHQQPTLIQGRQILEVQLEANEIYQAW